MNLMGRVVVVFGLVGLSGSSFSMLLLTTAVRPQVGLLAKSDMLIWNPETKIEHYIQSPIFYSNMKEFDFVTPTPTMPKIEMIRERFFESNYGILHPKRPQNRTLEVENPEGKTPGVEVKQHVQIGNIEATTVRASDVLVLDKWLTANGYKPSLAQNLWLEKYLKQRWYLTAFKVKSEESMMQTQAIRMSFKTDVPVNPYFSPAMSWLRGVRLELYVVSPVTLQGYVGTKKLWAGKEDSHVFLNPVQSATIAKQLKLKPQDVPKKSWMTRYVEIGNGLSNVDDIYFFPVRKVVTPAQKVRKKM